jgi:putative ABC transport system permease protein
MLKGTVKLALLVLRRRKFFTFISLFGIAFTLTVLLVVTAMLDHVLAAGAPESRLGRMLFIPYIRLEGENMVSSGAPGYALLERTARDLPGVEIASFYTEGQPVASYRDGEKIVSRMRQVDPDYWRIFDFTFVEGGPTTAGDEANAEPVVVLTEAARKRYFGARTGIVGETLELDGRTYRVRGVVKTVPSARLGAYSDMWAPLSTIQGDRWRQEIRGGFNAALLARDAASFPAIKAEYRARLGRLEMPDPERFQRARGTALTRLEEMVRDTLPGDPDGVPMARALTIFFGSAFAFLLLPAVNLVNINISRIIERSSEIGVRKAFGASSGHLVVQFVVENVVLCVLGGLLGLLGAGAALAWLNASDIIPVARFGLNIRVFGWALVLSAFFGVLSGVYPAWRMSRLHPVRALKGAAS